jgi:quercetin dioxygenase-like cupin family protein
MEPGRPAVFKLLADQTAGNIAVFEEAVPVGMGTPLHIHRTSDEVLHVQAGDFRFQLAGEQRQVCAGAWVYIPRGWVHGWRNTGTTEGQLLNIFAPAAGARAFEEMRRQGKPVPEIDPSIRDEIFARNGYEFITWDW